MLLFSRLVISPCKWAKVNNVPLSFCRLFLTLERHAAAAIDPQEKAQLLQMSSQLSGVIEDLSKYGQMLQRFLDAPDVEWEPMLALMRKPLLTPGFWEYVGRIIASTDKGDGEPHIPRHGNSHPLWHCLKGQRINVALGKGLICWVCRMSP